MGYSNNCGDGKSLETIAVRPKNALALGSAGQVKLVTAVAAISPERQPGARYNDLRFLSRTVTQFPEADAQPCSHFRLFLLPRCHVRDNYIPISPLHSSHLHPAWQSFTLCGQGKAIKDANQLNNFLNMPPPTSFPLIRYDRSLIGNRPKDYMNTLMLK